MKPCEHKIKMTPEEEKALNESVFKILSEGYRTVRERFPGIDDLKVVKTEGWFKAQS